MTDEARGELSARDARTLARRLAALDLAEADALRRGVARFLDLVAGAHAEALEPAMPGRLVARIRAQDARETAREAAESAPVATALQTAWRRRLGWARLLTISVAAHVLVLALVLVESHQTAEESAPELDIAMGARTPSDVEPLPDPIANPWVPVPWDSVPHFDPRLGGGDPLRPGLPPTAEVLDPLEQAHAHPSTVAWALLPRLDAGLKAARLEGVGLDADGTLATVNLGLRGLESRVRPDGAFPAGGGRSEIGQTALALLPFLGDGHGSRSDGPRAELVRRGVAWLRGRLRADGGPTDVPASELGMALKALSEDYMMSYGRLAPADAARRADELVHLADHLAARQALDGAFPVGTGLSPGEAAVWPMWGLDAAAQTGAVVPPAEVAVRFGDWYRRRVADAGDDPALAAMGVLLARDLGPSFAPTSDDRVATVVGGDMATADALTLATAGTGLFRTDMDAFRVWSRGLGERIRGRLLPNGVVTRGDPIGDTALVLLALQSAYRTY